MKYAKPLCLLLAIACLPGLACAGQTPQAEMTLTGHIEIAPDGSVTGYQIDRPSRVPKAAKAIIAKTVPAWKFVPVRVNGKTVPAKSDMRVHLTAIQTGKDSYSIGIDSAWFRSKDAVNDAEIMHWRDKKVPRYPPAAIKQRVQGIVYTVLRINRQGKVDKVAIRQVNLRTRGMEAQMRRWRHLFAMASKNAVKHWIFTPPATGPKAGKDYWVTAVPIIFNLNATGRSRKNYQSYLYGKWRPFIPGPKQFIPWVNDAEKRLVANVEALPGSGISSAGQTLHLLTPLSNGG